MNASVNLPWRVLVVDDDPDIVTLTRMALRRANYFSRPVHVIAAPSARQAKAMLADENITELTVALVDVVMEHETAGLELVAWLRSRFGNALQIIVRTGQPGVIGPEDVAQRFEISNYITKQDATPELVRTVVGLGVRNYRVLSAMAVLTGSLAGFASMFEIVFNTEGLDAILDSAIAQYAAVWEFDYVLLKDLDQPPPEDAPDWARKGFAGIAAVERDRHRSVAFAKVDGGDDGGTWAFTVRPLSGRFYSGLLLRQACTPAVDFFQSIQMLLRGWAVARESIMLKQVANDAQRVREEMHRERRESIAQMVASVAHEVNTPLGVANTAAASLRDVVRSPKFAEVCKGAGLDAELDDALLAVSLIERNIARADALIRGFKNLSVRQLVDQFEDVDLAACLTDVIKSYEPKARRAKITVNLQDKLPLESRRWKGYPGHLSQVLLNFITNAQRYAYHDTDGGKIDVTISASDHEGQTMFELAVRDHGVGIRPEHLPLIFGSFFTTGRDRGGSGLGLAIVQTIVSEVLHGSIHAESELGKGSTFTVRFPHCSKRPDPSPSAAAISKDQAADETAQHFNSFIELQRKFLTLRKLDPEEQVRLTEAKAAVDQHLADQWRGTERRNHSRVPASRPVKAMQGDSSLDTLLRDLSGNGALHVFPRKVETGTRLLLDYFSEPTLAINAEIISCSEMVGEGSGDRWLTGVAFHDVTPQQAHMLKILIAQLVLEYWS